MTNTCNTPPENMACPFAGQFRWMAAPASIFAISRAVMFGMAVFALHMDGRLNSEQTKVSDNLAVQALTRWDGGWFIQIATHGYRESRDTNFFPLFPLLGHVVHRITGLSVPVALLLCANLASLAAYLVVYRVFFDFEGAATANAALCLIAAWPFSFFHAAAYPESLMMLCTAASMLLVRRNRCMPAGFCLGMGMLARHLSAAAGLALLWHGLRSHSSQPDPTGRSRTWAALGLAALFPCAYFAFLQHQFGDWAAWIRARQAWGGYAWWGLRELFTPGIYRPPEMFVYALLSVLPGIGAFLLLTRPHWRWLAPFALGLMGVLWLAGLAGLGRYCASCWPAFLPLGYHLARRSLILASTVTALALTQGVMLHLFVHLYPIM